MSYELAEAFFHSLYAPALTEPDLLEHAKITLWTLPDKKSVHIPLSDLNLAAITAMQLDAEGKDVYFGVALRIPGLTEYARGKKEDLGAVTALWLDIDIADAGNTHAAKNLPSTTAEAHEILAVSKVPPSAVIHSGHGLHAYWFLDAPHPLLETAQVEEFERIMESVQAHAKEYAAKRGWHLDLLASADRVLRVPGTHNHKGTTTASAASATAA